MHVSNKLLTCVPVNRVLVRCCCVQRLTRLLPCRTPQALLTGFVPALLVQLWQVRTPRRAAPAASCCLQRFITQSRVWPPARGPCVLPPRCWPIHVPSVAALALLIPHTKRQHPRQGLVMPRLVFWAAQSEARHYNLSSLDRRMGTIYL